MCTRSAVGDQSCNYSDSHGDSHSPLTGPEQAWGWMGPTSRPRHLLLLVLQLKETLVSLTP